MNEPRYPDIEVRLSGHNGNAYYIIGRVKNALRRARVPDSKVQKFIEQAMSGNYDNLLATCMKWVTVS